MATASASPRSAARRVGRWPLRSAALWGWLYAEALVGALWARGYVHTAAAIALAVLVLGARTAWGRRLARSRHADRADLRAAGPVLTPDERARALEYVEPADQLRAHLESLPGGIRARSRLALRDPDAPAAPRRFAVRALAIYPLGMAVPAAIATAVHGTPSAVEHMTGMLVLLGPPALTYLDRDAREMPVTRRAFWALLSASCLPFLALGAVALAALLG